MAITLNYGALADTPVAPSPFPHVAVPGFVSEADLTALVAAMPDMRSGGSYPPEGFNLSPLIVELVV